MELSVAPRYDPLRAGALPRVSDALEQSPVSSEPQSPPVNGPVLKEVLRMTKADIVQAVYTKLGGFSKKEAADLVDQVFDSMKETLGRGEKIKISGFGNFVLGTSASGRVGTRRPANRL